MNSFNHYAYGAVGEWMYRTLAGVSAAEPGYRKVMIAPTPGEGITSAGLEHRTPYGVVGSRWKQESDGRFTLEVRVPANTTATVKLPGPADRVSEGGLGLRQVEGVREVVDGVGTTVTVGSGTYRFSVRP
jgi:alpha-L-rhamnosidase